MKQNNVGALNIIVVAAVSTSIVIVLDYFGVLAWIKNKV